MSSEVSMILMEDEEVLFPSQTPQASVSETTSRRRRKKAKGEGGAKKRRLREDQLKFLETCFEDETRLEMGRKNKLATELGLDAKQVAVWFQNRRARHKNKQMAEAYAKLRGAYNVAEVEKCCLENEVLKLKQKLLEAEEEIRKLSPGAHAASGCSLSSSFSVAAAAAATGELGVGTGGGEDDFMYMHEYDFTDYIMMKEWVNFYGV